MGEPTPETHLNVGCGSNLLDGWMNADLWEPQNVGDHVFRTMDAGNAPWPFDADRFERVYAGCVLPHLPPAPATRDDPIHVFLTEAYRVLKPGGVLELTAPDPRDVARALGRVHHYRLIHPEMFHGYVGERKDKGVKIARGGPYRQLDVDWGWWGTHRHHRTDKTGRPVGVSRILPGLMPLGRSKLGVLTHIFRRLRLRFLLRGEKLRVRLTK